MHVESDEHRYDIANSLNCLEGSMAKKAKKAKKANKAKKKKGK